MGETEFFGFPFLVNKQVLIPRPETEELIAWIIEDVKEKKTTLLDIGTGSGCIAISLAKKLKDASVTAIDVSKEAIDVAKKNSAQNHTKIEFMEVDVLHFKDNVELQQKLNSKFDIIVSNPPYVRIKEQELMRPNVLKHEPDLALYVANETPLLFYRKIVQLSKLYLKAGGRLYFEINEYLSNEMKKMLMEEGFKHVQIKKDMFGKDRMIKCW